MLNACAAHVVAEKLDARVSNGLPCPIIPGLMSGGTDKILVANVYYALAARLTAKAAAVIGRKEEAEEYGTLYERIREELNTEFVTANGRLVSETQTACVLLHFDLLKPEYRGRVMRTLQGNLTVIRGSNRSGACRYFE